LETDDMTAASEGMLYKTL